MYDSEKKWWQLLIGGIVNLLAAFGLGAILGYLLYEVLK